MSTPFEEKTIDKPAFVRALLGKAGFEADAIKNLVGKILEIASREKFETSHPFFNIEATVAKMARLPDMTRDRAISRIENKPALLLEHCTAPVTPAPAVTPAAVSPPVAAPAVTAVVTPVAAPIAVAPAEKKAPAVLLAGNKVEPPVQEKPVVETVFRSGLSPKKIFNLVRDYIVRNEDLPPSTPSFVLVTEFGNVAVHQIESALGSAKVADLLAIPQIKHISQSIKIGSIDTLSQFILFSGLAKSEKSTSGSKLTAVIPPPPALA